MIKEGKISDIACKKCGGQTTHYHCEEDECEGYLDNGSWCISLHEHDNDWYKCVTCSCYHVACKQCMNRENKVENKVVLCRLIGHGGSFIVPCKNNSCRCDDRWKIRLPLSLKKEVEDNIQDLDDPKDCEWLNIEQTITFHQDYDEGNYPLYYTGDHNIYYLDPTIILPNGPDGGLCNEWKCPNCNFMFHCNDK